MYHTSYSTLLFLETNTKLQADTEKVNCVNANEKLNYLHVSVYKDTIAHEL